MISYTVLHFNRPYLLEINVKLLRKYLPGIQIIIADDGSSKDVMRKIKKFEIDDLVTTMHLSGDHKYHGSVSNVLELAIKLCKHPHYIFSEDDFWYIGKSNPYSIKEVPLNNFVRDVCFLILRNISAYKSV